MNSLIVMLAAGMVFPSSEVTLRSFDKAEIRDENGVAVVKVAPNRNFCGVKFCFPEARDFTQYREVKAEVSNRTDRTMSFVFHGIHDGSHARIFPQTFRLGPYEGTVVDATCSRKCYSLPPTGGLVGTHGYDREFRPDRLDFAQSVNAFIVFRENMDFPGEFDVKRIWTEGAQANSVLPLDENFFPFVDEFGQYVHQEWPGKIHSVSELREAARREEEDLKAHPESPIPGTDRFGGWGQGPQLKATGLFRTEKWNGRWWLVDPDGHVFFSLGCNYVRLQGRTPVTGRERYFSWLPAKDSPRFGSCWHRQKLGWLVKCFYSGKGDVSLFDYAEANQIRIYGMDWKPVFNERQHRRMRSWGFTSMGNWSDPEIMALSRTPYVDNFNLDSARKIEGDKKGVWRKFPDVFAPDFADKVRECACKTRIAKSRTDPWCIGWFVENELHWASGFRNGDLARAVVDSPKDQPARVEYLRRLKAAHGPDATFANATAEDVRAFEAEISERYFRTVKQAIEKVAPGRLYLGCRFCNSFPDAIQATARYCDVVSYNCYERLPNYRRHPGSDQIDKPVIIGEFHFGSLDRGSMHAGLVPCLDMADRIEHYKRYVRAAIRDERLVGVHWFFWHDMPLTGWMDGENFGNGVMDVADNPHPEMIAATRELAREFYAPIGTDANDGASAAGPLRASP